MHFDKIVRKVVFNLFNQGNLSLQFKQIERKKFKREMHPIFSAVQKGYLVFRLEVDILG